MSIDADFDMDGFEKNENLSSSLPPEIALWENREVITKQSNQSLDDSEKKTQAIFQEQSQHLEQQLKSIQQERVSHPVGPPQLNFWDRLKNFWKEQEFFSSLKEGVQNLLPENSIRLPTLGKPQDHLFVLGINGMNTSLENAFSHQAYLKSLASDRVAIDFIYNHSNHIGVDLLEIFTLNYHGISPYTSNLLQQAWQEFADKNRDHPERKILQPCHSQGTIHVYNALLNSSEELRNRVIVVAIAPAKVIPQRICSASFNYASKLDIVHYGELLRGGFFETQEFGTSPRFETLLEDRSELILLDPDPEAKGIDHNFESPTFRKYLIEHLENYLRSNK